MTKASPYRFFRIPEGPNTTPGPGLVFMARNIRCSNYPTERDRLVAAGIILPLQHRPTLRMDAAGYRAAERHMFDYFREPAQFEDNFWEQDPVVMP